LPLIAQLRNESYWQTVSLRDQMMLAESNRVQLQALAHDLAYKADLLRAQVPLRDAEVQLLRTRDGQRPSKLVMR